MEKEFSIRSRSFWKMHQERIYTFEAYKPNDSQILLSFSFSPIWLTQSHPHYIALLLRRSMLTHNSAKLTLGFESLSQERTNLKLQNNMLLHVTNKNPCSGLQLETICNPDIGEAVPEGLGACPQNKETSDYYPFSGTNQKHCSCRQRAMPQLLITYIRRSGPGRCGVDGFVIRH